MDWCLLSDVRVMEQGSAISIPGRTGPSWPWIVAVAFVVVILLALVMVPWAVQGRVNALRSEIAAVEPARTLVIEWQFNLVREMAALNELLLSGDTTQYTTYGGAWTAEQSISEELAPLARQLGPEVLEPFTHARTLASQWHQRVDDEELLRQRAEDIQMTPIPRERQLFEQVLRSVALVDSTIMRVADRRRAEIVAAERTGLTLTLVLGFLAFVAAAAVIALETRVRRFAAEADRQRVEAAEALAEAARAEDTRARLLRGITHDVKNPLGSARGYAELLAMGAKAPLAPEQAPLVEGINRSIDGALAIIADLLDLARVGSGGISLNRVEIDLNDLAAQAAADHGGAAEVRRQVLKAEEAPHPLIVRTDPVRVRQVLDNLLSNAIKYTPPSGRIVVRAGVRDGDAARPGPWGVIEVSDTGPGIPPAERESVFDEFTRLDESAPAHGHGLGLSVARRLSRRLGGDLTIDDTEPGATFVFWIPQREATGDPPAETAG